MAIGKIARPIKGELPETTQEFIANAENYIPDPIDPFDANLLKKLTLEELAVRYKEIDYQSQLFKGQILLEARDRFQSNIEFGQWLSVNFTELNSSNTGKLINLARFFQGDRTLQGIPVSAGYLISAPKNKEIAEDVYREIKDKNLKLEEIKAVINSYKQETTAFSEEDNNETKDKKTRLSMDVTAFASHLLESTFFGKSDAFIKSVLTEALVQLSNRHEN
ncbi:MAG: hypothetical protein K9L22_04900 [Methylococcaceae bacterium]|nr:hypothetical protein [Methylococcaceae bacterium]